MKSVSFPRPAAPALAPLAVLLFSFGPAQAQTYFTNGGGTLDISLGTNWSNGLPLALPTPGGTSTNRRAYIGAAPGTPGVSAAGGIAFDALLSSTLSTVDELQIGTEAFAYSTTTGVPSGTSGSNFDGPGGAATLTIQSGGNLTVNRNMVIGQGRDNANDNSGVVTVEAGGTLTHAWDRLFIGFYDNDNLGSTQGTLTINGGTVNSLKAANRLIIGGWDSTNANNFGRGGVELNSGALNTVNTIVGSGGGAGTVTIAGGTWNNSGFFTTAAGGTMRANTTGGTITMTGGALNIAGDFTVHEAGTAGTTASSTFNMSGGSLTVNGTSFSVVGRAATNTGKGFFNLSGGTIDQNNSDWRVAGVNTGAQGEMTVSGSGILNINNTRTLHIGQTTNSNGLLTQSGGQVNISATSTNGLQLGATTSTAVYNLNGGVLTLPKLTVSAAATSTQLNLNGGTLKANAGFTVAATTNFSSTLGASGGTINTNGNNVVWNSPLGGPGGLTKDGAGTLTLGGTHTFAGLTTVNGGTLEVLGSLAGGVVTTSGATVIGTGTVAGGVTLAGTNLSPGGAGVGALTFSSSVTLDSASVITLTINDHTAGNLDQVLNSGTFNAGSATLSGTFTDATFNTATGAGDLAAATRYPIVTGPVSGFFGNSSVMSAGDIAALGVPAGSREITFSGQRFYVEVGSFNLVPLAPVLMPEPSAIAALSLSGLLLLRRRRR